MKTKILFLIALLVGFNPLARSTNDDTNVSSICEEDLVIDECIEEGITPNTRVKELLGNCGTNWSGIRTTRTKKTSKTITIFWEHARTLSYYSPEPFYSVAWKLSTATNYPRGNSFAVTSGKTDATVQGLEPSTRYTIRLERICGSGSGSGDVKFSIVNILTASSGIDFPDPEVDCNRPTELSITNITPNSVEVKYENYNVSKKLQ